MNNIFENGVVMISPEEYAKLVSAKTLLDVERDAHHECKLGKAAAQIKLNMYDEWFSSNSYYKDCFEAWKDKEYGRD